MHVISYVSNSTIVKDSVQAEISNIVDVAQKKNFEHGVTGVLFFENEHFFQTIEGPEDDLRKIFDSIERDNRHHELNKLIDEPIAERAFPDWSMDAFYIDSPELVKPETIRTLQTLYVQNFGVDTVGLVEFIKRMIDEIDTFKIERSPFKA